MDLFPRGLTSRIRSAWSGHPIVVLEGLRSTGKTTIARSLVAPDRFFSLAEPLTLRRALDDPLGWLESLPLGSVVDEVQIVPGLTVVAKNLVDRRVGAPGQFLFTGSARVARNELGGSDALVGRAHWVRVEPFAQCEIERTPRDVIRALYDDDPREWSVVPTPHAELARRFSLGGHPTLRTTDPATRIDAAAQFVESLFRGDIYRTRRNRDEIVRFFGHIAATSSQREVFDRIGAKAELTKPTIQAYLQVLRDVFLVDEVPGYRANAAKRVTEKRRLFAVDPLFVATALRIDSDIALFDAEHGGFLETIVECELRRLMGWTSTPAPRLFHWRKSERDEVDLVIERNDGKVLAIEVKAARTLGANATDGFASFRKEYPDEFHRGFVFHSGDHVAQIAPNTWSLPFSALWTIGDSLAAPVADLREELDRAREEILRRRHERTVVQQTREQLASTRIDEATRRFMAVAMLLSDLKPKLQELGFQVGLTDTDVATVPNGKRIWYGRRSLQIHGPKGAAQLRLQARIFEPNIDMTDWLVDLVDVDADDIRSLSATDLGTAFTLPWNEDAVPQVLARVQQFVSLLPELFEVLVGFDG